MSLSRTDEGIEYRQWVAPEPGAVFLLVHGIGAQTGRWEALGDFLVKNNISSYAIECPHPEQYGGDILSLRAIASKNNPGKKIFLLGESLGAIASISMAASNPHLFDCLICFSPAFKNRVNLPVADYFKIFAALIADPNKMFKLPFESSMCARDADYIKKMDADECELRETSARSILEILLFQIRAGASLKKLLIPVLFLVAGADKIVYPATSVEMFNRIPFKDKTLIEYPQMYHSLSVELGKEKVFEDLLRWVEKRI